MGRAVFADELVFLHFLSIWHCKCWICGYERGVTISMSKKNKIVLVAVHDENRDYYQKLLERHKYILLSTYSTLFHFRRESNGELFCGFIVDIRTLIESPMEDKEFYSSLCKGFPVLQVDYSSDHREINCLIEGDSCSKYKGKDLLDYYIQTNCEKMKPRGVRLHKRKGVFFDTRVFQTQGGSPIFTNLWDISEGGCYVIGPDSSKKPGHRLWLSIEGLLDEKPIESEVKWTKPWGSTVEKLPGYGVSFLNLTDTQQKSIQKVIAAE